ncbi:MAG: hypothetical protein M1825_003488 [Sarcosagium campestre]|nr:MAG: hypothetical protein M1825_003488 [Sarcosagium campestre]
MAGHQHDGSWQPRPVVADVKEGGEFIATSVRTTIRYVQGWEASRELRRRTELQFDDTTLTYKGPNNPAQTAPVFDTLPVSIATDSTSVGQPGIVAASATSSSATASATSSESEPQSGGLSPNVQRILIAAGAAVVFVTILFLFYIVFRVRRRTTGSFLGFFKRKDRQESLPTIRTPKGDWDFKDADTNDSREGFAPSSRSSPAPRSPANSALSPRSDHAPFAPAPAFSSFMPAPLRTRQSTFIGREGNQLVRASLNRHQLSTLDEQSSMKADSEPLPAFPPKASLPFQGPGLAQQISVSATALHISDARQSYDSISSGFGDGTLPPPLASPGILPLQHSKASNRNTSRSSWMTDIQPLTAALPADHRPSVAASVDTLPRFRSVNGWVDYQSTRTAAEHNRKPSGLQFQHPPMPSNPPSPSRYRPDSADIIHFQPGDEVRFTFASDDVSPIEGASRSYSPPSVKSSGSGTVFPGYNNNANSAPIRRMDSNSTATVFKYHPGEEVQIDRQSLVRSEVLDEYTWR